MWPPDQAPAIAATAGLALDPAALGDPKGAPLGAVVQVGGYCSASFVSPDGLIATNHHCVQEYLQVASTADHNYAFDGFTAASRGDEVSGGPTATVYVVDQIEDVTAKVKALADAAKDDVARALAIEQVQKDLVAKCEKTSDECYVTAYAGGQAYKLVHRTEIRDVRLVWAPPMGTGQFGGEIDNWMWPRHGADVSLLRAYVAPNGKPAEFSTKNVPYRPPRWLKVAAAGSQDGDAVFVAGYPGSTQRDVPAAILRWELGHIPAEIDYQQRLYDLYVGWIAKDEQAAAKLVDPRDEVGNGLKYNRGLLADMKLIDVMAIREAKEAEIRAWIAADPKRAAQWKAPTDEWFTLAAERTQTLARTATAGALYTSAFPGLAGRIYRFAVERTKPDRERDPGYQERDLARAIDRSAQVPDAVFLPADREALVLSLRWYAAQPAENRVAELDAWLAGLGGPEAAAIALFDGAGKAFVSDAAYRRSLFSGSAATLSASADPWMAFGKAWEAYAVPRRLRDRAWSGARSRLLPTWVEARTAFATTPSYPDANSTLRLTFGHVAGYAPRDGVWHTPYTTLAGIAQKAGEAPFDIDPAVLARIADGPKSPYADPKLGNVPVCFLTDVDTTGGNSGSPTLDANGNLIGLIFDGNYEAVSSDWFFTPSLTRSIHIDVRYLLWLLDGEADARWLLGELDFVK